MAMIACVDMGVLLGGMGRTGHAGDEGAGAAGGGSSVGPVRIESEPPPDRFALGAPCVVPACAPRAEDHAAPCSDGHIRALFSRKSAQREAAIQAILDQARAEGRVMERFMAAIAYDTEQAPRTTNRAQLLELGIVVPAVDAIPAADDEAHRLLWTIIYGLARLGIYLTGTDGLDDRALLGKLCGTVLGDQVADIPPSADMSEFIDLTPMTLASRVGLGDMQGDIDGDTVAAGPDGLSGPLDFDPDEEDDSLGRQGARPASVGQAIGAQVVDRDSMLPKPDRR